MFPLLFIGLFLFFSGMSYVKHNWVTVYATRSTTLLHDSLLFRPDGENFVPVTALQHKEVIIHGSRETNKIALTFDADMTPGMKNLLDSGEVASYYNKGVIDVLTQTQTKATLFLAGMWIETYPEVTKELARSSLFELTSHSYSHPGFDGPAVRRLEGHRLPGDRRRRIPPRGSNGVTGHRFSRRADRHRHG